jgi:transposase
MPMLPNEPRGVPRVDDRQLVVTIRAMIRDNQPWVASRRLLPNWLGKLERAKRRFDKSAYFDLDQFIANDLQ